MLGAVLLKRREKTVDLLPFRPYLPSQGNAPLLIPHANGQMALALVNGDKRHSSVLLCSKLGLGDPPSIRRPTNPAGEPTSVME